VCRVVGPNVTGPVLIGPNMTSVGDEFTFTCHLSASVSATSVQYQVAMAYDGQVDTTNIKTATSQDVTFTTTDFTGHFQQLVIQLSAIRILISHHQLCQEYQIATDSTAAGVDYISVTYWI